MLHTSCFLGSSFEFCFWIKGSWQKVIACVEHVQFWWLPCHEHVSVLVSRWDGWHLFFFAHGNDVSLQQFLGAEAGLWGILGWEVWNLTKRKSSPRDRVRFDGIFLQPRRFLLDLEQAWRENLTFQKCTWQAKQGNCWQTAAPTFCPSQQLATWKTLQLQFLFRQSPTFKSWMPVHVLQDDAVLLEEIKTCSP